MSWKITYSINGGTYDDGLIVNDKFIFGHIMRRVFRSLADGPCMQASCIRVHLAKNGFMHTNKQISGALQRLKTLGAVEYIDDRWTIG